MFDSLENKAERLCEIINKNDSESWEVRNKAVMQLTDLISSEQYANNPEIFSLSFYRMIKEPVKSLIGDLRSQQVRDVCQFLITLAEITTGRMKSFMRDSFVFILDGAKISNKVMAGYVDQCIMSIIKNVTFKSAIVLLTNEIKDSKAKIFREKCLV